MSKDPVTLINVFTVEPAKQQQLIELLTAATEGSVRHAAGFISARLHRSLDGTKVTMYAQWRSNEDYQAMRGDSAALPYLQQALAIARLEPGMYEVVQTFCPGCTAMQRQDNRASTSQADPRHDDSDGGGDDTEREDTREPNQNEPPDASGPASGASVARVRRHS
jgi:quinol monooxygenase YgiN